MFQGYVGTFPIPSTAVSPFLPVSDSMRSRSSVLEASRMGKKLGHLMGFAWQIQVVLAWKKESIYQYVVYRGTYVYI